MNRADISIVTVNGKTPQIDPSAFIAPGCRIIGDVTIGPDVSIWYNCVLRADVSRIVVGARSNPESAQSALWQHSMLRWLGAKDVPEKIDLPHMMKADKRAIFTASARAQEAVNFLALLQSKS